MSIKKVEYLDLELETLTKGICNLNKKFRLKCQCQLGNQLVGGHELHGDQPILNTIVDFIITLGKKLDETDKNSTHVLTTLLEKIKLVYTLMQEKIENMHFIKAQNNDIFRSLKNIDFSSIEEIQQRHSRITSVQHELIEKIGLNTNTIEELRTRLQHIALKIELFEHLLIEIKKLILS